MKLNLYILSARRTPVGTFLGSLKNFGPVELGVIVAEAALKDSKVSGEEICHSIFGNVCSSSSADGPYLARHIALKAGVRVSAGSLNVNRLCGSGFEAIVQANTFASEGPCLVGGAENMSLTPLFIRNAREGFKFAQPPATIDSLWEALNDKHAKMSMGETAERLAQEYSITREDCDRWALMSHQRASKAEKDGKFLKEIVPVTLADGKIFDKEEHIRHESSAEKLAKLKPVFKGVTTAGNASGMNDAGAALVVADEAFAKKWSQTTGLKPLAKIIGVVSVGCDPTRMGIGPVAAIRKLSDEIQWDYSKLDYIEVNEAFAAQVLSVKKELKLSDAQLNPHGSGISLGHPLGATGARISSHIAHLIASGELKRAIGSACIGGGQGIAVAFEAV
ncbi:MAG: Acetyl-CoA C-acyltransferase [Bacteriovoracaceae bacterium]|nr:Acetyl-CoA C-acyltransferase [Bacteriovoracaceae bacterium]